MKNLFTVKSEEEVEMDKIEKWSQITAIEKVADFVAKFMKETGIESHAVISDIMDNLHKEWADDFDNIEFRNVEFIKVNTKEFAKEINLINSNMEHSWAGSESNEDTASLLYGNKDNFEFGESYDYQYYNNGNQTADEERVSEGEFNIKETYVVLIKNRSYSDYNNNYYDDTTYKCIAYVGDEAVYNFEHKEIIEKYGIAEKVLSKKSEKLV